jgi:thiol-disulfide isomerase/thioredoxin
MTNPTLARSRGRTWIAAIGTLVGVGIGYAGVASYRSFSAPPAAAGPCGNAVTLAQQLSPLMKGEIAALTPAAKPLQIPDLGFEDAQGARKTMADFRGKTVLLNLWATWCVPCRKEMPALDRLQQQRGGERFDVVAVNIDTRDPQKPKAFMEEAKLDSLAYFTDRSARIFQDLKAVGRAIGMPTSVLIDGNGCEIATIAGPAEWDSADALALIDAALRDTPAR